MAGMLTLLLSLSLASAADVTSVDQAVDQALAHPRITAAHTETAAAARSADVAGVWMDPMFAVELSNAALGPVGLTHPMSGVQLKLSQQLSFDSGARSDAALAKVDVAERREALTANALEREVRVAWARAGSAHAMAELHAEHEARVAELREVATRHYEVGKGGQSALLRLAVVEQRAAEEQAEWAREARVWEAVLAELTGAAVVVDTRPVAVPVSDGALSHPELAMREAQVAALRADASRLAKQGLPEPTVWAGYRVRTEASGGDDLVSVGISAPIPVSSTRRASGLAAARDQQAEAAVFGVEDAERRLSRELVVARERWSRAYARAETYGGVLVPQAEAARTATISDYTVGRAAFADVLEAEVALLELSRVAVAAAAETEVQAAIAASLTGD